MLRRFRKVISKSIHGEVLVKMPSTRYFPNPFDDYGRDKTKTAVHVPMDYLKNFIAILTKRITTNVKPVTRNAEDGLYLGTAGVAYMFYHLSKYTHFGNRDNYLKQAIDYLKPALELAEKSQDQVGFILGASGVYCLAAAIYQEVGDQNKSDYYKAMFGGLGTICQRPNFLKAGSDEVFVGRAGYILGALWLSKETGIDLTKSLHEICNIVVESGRTFAKAHHSPCPLMYAYYGSQYLGAAHGLCSILQALISVPNYLDAYPANSQDIQATVDYLLSLQDADGNFPATMDETGQRSKLVHWCHGAPGVFYLMAKAFLVWNNVKYLQACERMGDLVWERGLLRKGPGICHGVTGNAYCFLVLFRLTQQEKHLYRAIKFAEFLDDATFKQEARTPDSPYSLYEGIAGTVCYLVDLSEPSQAAFPFFDVFK